MTKGRGLRKNPPPEPREDTFLLVKLPDCTTLPWQPQHPPLNGMSVHRARLTRPIGDPWPPSFLLFLIHSQPTSRPDSEARLGQPTGHPGHSRCLIVPIQARLCLPQTSGASYPSPGLMNCSLCFRVIIPRWLTALCTHGVFHFFFLSLPISSPPLLTHKDTAMTLKRYPPKHL